MRFGASMVHQMGVSPNARRRFCNRRIIEIQDWDHAVCMPASVSMSTLKRDTAVKHALTRQMQVSRHCSENAKSTACELHMYFLFVSMCLEFAGDMYGIPRVLSPSGPPNPSVTSCGGKSCAQGSDVDDNECYGLQSQRGTRCCKSRTGLAHSEPPNFCISHEAAPGFVEVRPLRDNSWATPTQRRAQQPRNED